MHHGRSKDHFLSRKVHRSQVLRQLAHPEEEREKWCEDPYHIWDDYDDWYDHEQEIWDALHAQEIEEDEDYDEEYYDDEYYDPWDNYDPDWTAEEPRRANLTRASAPWDF